MKYLKYYFKLLLLSVVFAKECRTDSVSDSEENEDQTFALDKLPILASIPDVNFKGPVAPIFVRSLLTIALGSKILSSNESTDFVNSQTKLNEQLSIIPSQISDEIARFPDITVSYILFEKLRNDLDRMRQAVSDNMEIIMSSKTYGLAKKATMNAMLDNNSGFRKTLKSFINKYIIPKSLVTATDDVSLLYDFILEKNRNATVEGNDCNFESVHTKIFKSYIYLLETLSEAYGMVISAHIVQYQIELKTDIESALSIQKSSKNLIDQYQTDMKLLMEKTKWALKEASRDVRRCGTFEYLERGGTFNSVSFAHIMPKLKGFNFKFRFNCETYERDVKYHNFEIGECKDGGFTRPASLSVFLNPRNIKWPYVFMKNEPMLGEVQTFGNSSSSVVGLIKHEYNQIPKCFSEFCKVFRKKVVGVSTQLVSGAEGTVITGVRLSVRRDIIYIDVREGKLLDDLTIDPTSLKWIQTPTNYNEVLYLDSNIRRFELGDVEVEGNDYLRSIQFVLKSEVGGIIGLSVNEEPSEYTLKSNEIDLSKSARPEKFGPGVKNLISKAPKPSEPYHVSLQSSDFKKDFGATTIPYFDTREVITVPAAPLSGIGMYHQTVEDSGGYISLKLKQINLDRFVDYDLIKKTINSPFKIL